jgi:hypothetical protein
VNSVALIGRLTANPETPDRRAAARTISGKETLMIGTRIYDAIEEFVAELLHADQLVKEQAEQIDVLEAEVATLRAALARAASAW